jgi:plasmid replication initiation protein
MEELLVVKSNRLIEASYRLSLYEQQLILFAIVQARETQTGLSFQKPVVIKVQDFMKAYDMTDTSGNVYRYLKEAIHTLFKRSVTIYHDLENTDKPAVTEMRWITKRIYSDSEGYLSFNFSPDVIPYITRLETEFTSYDLKQVGNFTSVHAVRLFELLKQVQAIGKREIKLDALRKMLQLEDSYPVYSMLILRVIDPAVEQINTHTDFKVEYKPIKQSRKIIALAFTIKSKNKASKPRQTHMRLNTPQHTTGSHTEPQQPPQANTTHIPATDEVAKKHLAEMQQALIKKITLQ